MIKFGQNATSATNNVHTIRKSFQKDEIHAHFKKPCIKLKNLTSLLKILKSNLENMN